MTTDFKSHRWKDEAELTEAVSRGLIGAAEADAIRVEGERAVELLRTGRHVANTDWRRWHRDPSWPIPVLPEDWPRV